jgi:hypothetical protein
MRVTFAAYLLLQAALSFTTLAQGTISFVDKPAQVVIRTTAEWQALWKAHSPATPVPQVDFTRTIVVGVFLGSRPTAGFSVDIVSVREVSNRLVVEYRERRPEPGRLAAQVLTSPFHLVSLPRDIRSVEFTEVAQ